MSPCLILRIDRRKVGEKDADHHQFVTRDLEEKYGQRIFSRLMDKRNSAVISLKGRTSDFHQFRIKYTYFRC
jgi:hypothetical protein